ncbi:MAG: MBL fold metallo-hydrolase [Eubacteriales bacterium]|nr:MBL fold metallo-hydrolase [Eubacteriales bacterium]
MLRRLGAGLAFVLALMLISSAVAAPVYHLPSDTAAPFEKTAAFAEASILASESVLLQVDVLDIHQGDCIVLYAAGQTMLIDGGLKDRFAALKQYMSERKLDGFDVVFLTHAHPDHIEVQEEMVKAGYRIGKVIAPYDRNSLNIQWVNYRGLLDKAGIPYEKIASDQTFAFGEATLTFYQRVKDGLSINDQAVAAMVRVGDARMFLASDITCATQRWLIGQYGAEELACDIYKSAHHGIGSVVSEFLDALAPSASVVTNTQKRTAAHDRQLNRRGIARYYISMGTVHMQTDGTAWLMWQDSGV